jgi:DNA-binding beta-propeller fold protein YncE
MRPGAPFFKLIASACLLWLGAGCNLNNTGDEPARGSIYFPTALALSSSAAGQASRFLYVVNSNFDLRYSDGSVQAYDLDKLDALITKRCGKSPSIDCEIDSRDVIVDEVLISAFARGVASDPDHTRLYVPTRTDASLTFIDVDESGDGKSKRVLSCGDKTSRHCDDDHRRGDDAVQNERRLRFPDEPAGLVTGRAADLAQPGETPIDGNFVMVAHRGGEVSLFLDQAEGAKKSGPLLTDVIAEMPSEPTGIAFDPATQRAYVTVYDRVSGTLGNKVLARVGVAIDALHPEDSVLYSVGALNIDGVALAPDTRSIMFTDASDSRALVVSRQPAALLWIDVSGGADTGEPTRATTNLTVPVGDGPSRLSLGTLGTRKIAAVSCFDARQVFLLDAETGDVLSIVRNLSGPFEIVIDSERMRIYAADFRSSVVRVIDISPALAATATQSTEAKVIATLGEPRLIQELQ